MANTISLRSIANNTFNVLIVRFGESKNESISVGVGAGWDGSRSFPWVNGQSEMYKSIIVFGIDMSTKMYIFQDYHSQNNQIKYCYDGNYSSGQAIPGESASTGDDNKILLFDSVGSPEIH